jgi:hypothetical protein
MTGFAISNARIPADSGHSLPLPSSNVVFRTSFSSRYSGMRKSQIAKRESKIP